MGEDLLVSEETLRALRNAIGLLHEGVGALYEIVEMMTTSIDEKRKRELAQDPEATERALQMLIAVEEEGLAGEGPRPADPFPGSTARANPVTLPSEESFTSRLREVMDSDLRAQGRDFNKLTLSGLRDVLAALLPTTQERLSFTNARFWQVARPTSRLTGPFRAPALAAPTTLVGWKWEEMAGFFALERLPEMGAETSLMKCCLPLDRDGEVAAPLFARLAEGDMQDVTPNLLEQILFLTTNVPVYRDDKLYGRDSILTHCFSNLQGYATAWYLAAAQWLEQDQRLKEGGAELPQGMAEFLCNILDFGSRTTRKHVLRLLETPTPATAQYGTLRKHIPIHESEEADMLKKGIPLLALVTAVYLTPDEVADLHERKQECRNFDPHDEPSSSNFLHDIPPNERRAEYQGQGVHDRAGWSNVVKNLVAEVALYGSPRRGPPISRGPDPLHERDMALRVIPDRMSVGGDETRQLLRLTPEEAPTALTANDVDLVLSELRAANNRGKMTEAAWGSEYFTAPQKVFEACKLVKEAHPNIWAKLPAVAEIQNYRQELAPRVRAGLFQAARRSLLGVRRLVTVAEQLAPPGLVQVLFLPVLWGVLCSMHPNLIAKASPERRKAANIDGQLATYAWDLLDLLMAVPFSCLNRLMTADQLVALNDAYGRVVERGAEGSHPALDPATKAVVSRQRGISTHRVTLMRKQFKPLIHSLEAAIRANSCTQLMGVAEQAVELTKQYTTAPAAEEAAGEKAPATPDNQGRTKAAAGKGKGKRVIETKETAAKKSRQAQPFITLTEADYGKLGVDPNWQEAALRQVRQEGGSSRPGTAPPAPNLEDPTNTRTPARTGVATTKGGTTQTAVGVPSMKGAPKEAGSRTAPARTDAEEEIIAVEDDEEPLSSREAMIELWDRPKKTKKEWLAAVVEACMEYERSVIHKDFSRRAFQPIRERLQARLPFLVERMAKAIDSFINGDNHTPPCMTWKAGRWLKMSEELETDLRCGFGNDLKDLPGEEKDRARAYLSFVLIGRPFGKSSTPASGEEGSPLGGV
jgi:hypothetical protein